MINQFCLFIHYSKALLNEKWVNNYDYNWPICSQIVLKMSQIWLQYWPNMPKTSGTSEKICLKTLEILYTEIPLKHYQHGYEKILKF